MNLLYVATDQQVPGSTGGSVHVEEVARGLARRGHEVHVVARSGKRRGSEGIPEKAVPPAAAVAREGSGTAGKALPSRRAEEAVVLESGFHLHPARLLVPHRFFRWSVTASIGRLMDCLGAEVVLERYYNFGGEGIRAAARRGIPSVLEVNSPVVDHPGSLKSWLDRALLFRPMRRLRESQCRLASALVTPLPGIIPPGVPREKVFPIHWGANVDRFRPGLVPTGPAAQLPLPSGARVVVFSGSFRRWHGARIFVHAAARVISRKGSENAFFLLLGSGPELPGIKREVARLGIAQRVYIAGQVPYEEMPYYLARSHIGVAPYQPSRHGQLRLGFYWSPLKIFEYMASGLPVVTLDIEPLREIVRPDREGLLVGENDVEGLAEAIAELVSSPERSSAMGRAARERVVARYSWQLHCEKLEGVLERVARR